MAIPNGYFKWIVKINKYLHTNSRKKNAKWILQMNIPNEYSKWILEMDTPNTLNEYSKLIL